MKYSLFPPLGLATPAAHLDPDDEVTLEDEHVERVVDATSGEPVDEDAFSEAARRAV